MQAFGSVLRMVTEAMELPHFPNSPMASMTERLVGSVIRPKIVWTSSVKTDTLPVKISVPVRVRAAVCHTENVRVVPDIPVNSSLKVYPGPPLLVRSLNRLCNLEGRFVYYPIEGLARIHQGADDTAVVWRDSWHGAFRGLMKFAVA